jgi:hypothetical protein
MCLQRIHGEAIRLPAEIATAGRISETTAFVEKVLRCSA